MSDATESRDPVPGAANTDFGMASYVQPDYDGPDLDDDDDQDFTAEHVALVPPVEAEASRHLRRLVASWGMLSDLSFSDLLLYVPLTPIDDRADRFLVANQVRPNTGQTLFLDDVVGRTVSAAQRPVIARAYGTGEIDETVIDGAISEDRIRVTAIPVRFGGKPVAVLAREAALSMTRQRGVLERVYLEVFDRLARMVAAGTFPFAHEEVLAAGGPRVGDGVVLLDDNGRIVFTSPNAISALRRLGVSGLVEGATLTELGAETAATYRAFFTGQPAAEEVQREDVSVVLRCIPLFTGERVDGAVVLMRDVSELRSRDRLLVSKDATIKEIHHRVKNNLQTISSLLRLQGRRLTEPSAKTAIEESVRRIRSIALVHETLSRESGDELDFGEVVRPLVRMVQEGLTSPENPLRFQIVGDAGKLPSPVATSLAVILTELLQNVVDHAYPAGVLNGEDRPAAVVVEMTRSAGSLELAVVDDGVGMSPPAADADPGTSLGLSIVNGLVAELGGSIDFAVAHPDAVDGRTGTRVSLVVPLVLTPEPRTQRPPGPGGRAVGL